MMSVSQQYTGHGGLAQEKDQNSTEYRGKDGRPPGAPDGSPAAAPTDAREAAAWVARSVRALSDEIHRSIVGHDEVVQDVLTCLFCGGHALLEGVPGLGKTTLIKTLGQVLDLATSRIQFTPDLMPADIIGTNVLIQEEVQSAGASADTRRLVRFQKGPLFANIVLADEINRATPKTQSALLEAMQEQTVTVGGTTWKLEPPFIVLATQNPIEMEGTYPLPEAQLDRFFFKLALMYPGAGEIASIIDRTTAGEQEPLSRVLDAAAVMRIRALVREVPMATPVKDYAIRLALATRPDGGPGAGGAGGAPRSGAAAGTAATATDMVSRYVRYGSSPRGAQSMVLGAKARALFDGRMNAGFDDVKAVCRQSLRHRILLNFEGEAEGISAEALIDDILQRVTPAEG
jgi:MoxR-like ATPase